MSAPEIGDPAAKPQGRAPEGGSERCREAAPSVQLAPTPKDEVLRRGPMRVYRYRAPDSATPRRAVPVLLVPSIINRAYIFDLREGQSLAAALLARGLDVWLVDWGVPAPADARSGLGDYALRLLGKAIDAARDATGAGAVHLMGYCLGGTFALLHAARRPSAVASVIALTTPVDLGSAGSMGMLTDARLVDIEALARAFPIVPGEALWSAFQALDPTGGARKLRHIAELAQAEGEGREEKLARTLAQEKWLNDPVPMTARAVSDIVGSLYRENALAKGTLVLEGAPVRLADGKAPVLNAIARGDTVVPVDSSRALASLWGGPVEMVELGGGHIGVTVGSKAPQGLWQSAGDWLVARS